MTTPARAFPTLDETLHELGTDLVAHWTDRHDPGSGTALLVVRVRGSAGRLAHSPAWRRWSVRMRSGPGGGPTILRGNEFARWVRVPR